MATVWEAVLNHSEGRGPNERVCRDRGEQVDGSGCLVCVALLWALLLACWCVMQCQGGSEASVAMERYFAEFLFDLVLSMEQRLFV